MACRNLRVIRIHIVFEFFRGEIISPGHRNWQLKTAKYDVVCVCFFFFLCHTEDLHHQGDYGYRRRQQKQLSGAVRHHHQCEEPASAVGEGQLQRGHTGKHCPRHTYRGTLGRGLQNETSNCKVLV